MFICICSYFWVEGNLPKTESWKTFSNFHIPLFTEKWSCKKFSIPHPSSEATSHRPTGTEENSEYIKMQARKYIPTTTTTNNWSFPSTLSYQHPGMLQTHLECLSNISNSAAETKTTTDQNSQSLKSRNSQPQMDKHSSEIITISDHHSWSQERLAKIPTLQNSSGY